MAHFFFHSDLAFIWHVDKIVKLMGTMRVCLSLIMSSVRFKDRISSTDRVSNQWYSPLLRVKTALSFSLDHHNQERHTRCTVRPVKSGV